MALWTVSNNDEPNRGNLVSNARKDALDEPGESFSTNETTHSKEDWGVAESRVNPLGQPRLRRRPIGMFGCLNARRNDRALDRRDAATKTGLKRRVTDWNDVGSPTQAHPQQHLIQQIRVGDVKPVNGDYRGHAKQDAKWDEQCDQRVSEVDDTDAAASECKIPQEPPESNGQVDRQKWPGAVVDESDDAPTTPNLL
jgi:hypothetical protein